MCIGGNLIIGFVDCHSCFPAKRPGVTGIEKCRFSLNFRNNFSQSAGQMFRTDPNLDFGKSIMSITTAVGMPTMHTVYAHMHMHMCFSFSSVCKMDPGLIIVNELMTVCIEYLHLQNIWRGVIMWVEGFFLFCEERTHPRGEMMSSWRFRIGTGLQPSQAWCYRCCCLQRSIANTTQVCQVA